MPVKTTRIVDIEKVEKYMISHIHQRIRIIDLATRFNVSESFLRKNFKQDYGITIHQYLLQKSMEYAATAIAEGEAIVSIAFRLGYIYPGSFSRAFKNVHQVAPEHYKRQKIIGFV